MHPHTIARRLTAFLALFWFTTFAPLARATLPPSVPEHLQEISVTITTGHGSGSGVVFSRKVGADTINFVWTAAHVVDRLRTEREIVAADGSKRTIVEFADAKVVKELREDSRIVGRLELDAEVIKYSDAESGDDLALLRLRKRSFITDSVVFYLDAQPPTIGADLYHVGSLLGQMGSNSMTSGIISQDGRLIGKRVFMQSSAPGMPGSSGGGIFLRDGRLVALLVRGASDTFTLGVPVRRIVEFTKRNKVEWAINPAVVLPTEDEIRRLPIEDNPTLAGAKVDASKP